MSKMFDDLSELESSDSSAAYAARREAHDDPNKDGAAYHAPPTTRATQLHSSSPDVHEGGTATSTPQRALDTPQVSPIPVTQSARDASPPLTVSNKQREEEEEEEEMLKRPPPIVKPVASSGGAADARHNREDVVFDDLVDIRVSDMSAREAQQPQPSSGVVLQSGADKRGARALECAAEEEEEYPFLEYIFPRIDGNLVDSYLAQPPGAEKGKNYIPEPNCVESFFAYLLATDMRMSIYFAVLLLCMIFTVVSIPTSQIDFVGGGCYTYWGNKANCDAAIYTTPVSLITCDPIKTRLQAGAAFSIITVVAQSITLLACIVIIFCLSGSPRKVSGKARLVVFILSLVGCITQMICWAVIAAIYGSKYCQDDNVIDETRTSAYGVGFGLCLCSWLLGLCGSIILLLPRGMLMCKF